MTFWKILCPIDFSDGAKQAVQVATRLAIQRNAELVLLHSWYVPPVAFSMDLPFPTHVVQSVIDSGQQALDVAVRDAIEAGAKRTTGRLVTGQPWSEIVSVLEKETFDLCVIGTHGRTGLSRVLLGSVAEKVVRHAACSVLTVRVDNKVVPFQRVLVPTDYTESANFALALAESLVERDGAITLMHVLEFPVVYAGQPIDEFARDLNDRSIAELVAAATSVTTVRVTTDSRIGHPGGQILAALDEDPAIDLVVMGSHGRTGLGRLFLGSVAEKVVRHARCPVLVARKRAPIVEVPA